ncbi:hypothetical protein LCGC14_1931230 [marine sediment metagenome]|uniref:Uncharacterized protein n=1 Tax=marine sediment metagenome TaxID=412755 RepID=A0A0F9IKP8_9ZZZZ
MLKIGRYGIAFGPVFWVQTGRPAQVWHRLYFWFIKEARPDDIDTERHFLPNTLLEHEGRRYRYWRQGPTTEGKENKEG